MKYSIILALATVAYAQISSPAVTSDAAAATAAPTTGAPTTGAPPATGAGGNNPNAFVPIDGAKAGEPVVLKWENPSSGTCELSVRRGSDDNLDTVESIDSVPCSAGTYRWTPSTSLEDGSDYTIEIKDGENVNFMPKFAVSGGDGTAVSSSVTSSADLSEITGNATETNSTISAPEPSSTDDDEDEDDEKKTTRTTRTSEKTSSSSPSATDSQSAAGAVKLSVSALFGGLVVAMLTL